MAEIKEWLKRHYRDAPVSGPECKRVKFSDMLEEAALDLQVVNTSSLSHALNDVFSNSESKRAGVKRQSYVYGLEKDTTHLSPLEVALRNNSHLQQQVEQLQQKVLQLEQESALAKKLNAQMKSIVHTDMMCYHGPDTVGHLESFSLDECIAEFRVHAPDVVDLIGKLGNCSRHDDGEDGDEHSHIATLRLTTVLCTLLKCRSVKVLGLQLFLSIMLIARSTSKQVWIKLDSFTH